MLEAAWWILGKRDLRMCSIQLEPTGGGRAWWGIDPESRGWPAGEGASLIEAKPKSFC
jgi:hypothetical protein